MVGKGMALSPVLAILAGTTSTTYTMSWVDDAERNGDVS